jgi:Zn-dependent peptidase ImmA (M78 family)
MQENYDEKPRKVFAKSLANKLIEEIGFLEPPISLQKVIDYLQEKNKIQIVMHDTGENISGFIAYDYDEGIEYAIIAINENHGWFRKRFTIAHEIGHFFLQHKGSSIPKNIQESEAHTFAAELLLPKKFLGLDCKNRKLSLAQLKERYRVNGQVIYIKMDNDRFLKKYLGL